MNRSIRVLLVDDHPVVRTGYRHLLHTDAQIEVIAEADDSASACAAFKALSPDVVVMDISLPGISGIETTKRMRAHQPAARVLIFSMHNEAIFVSRARRCGAVGYLAKSSAPEKLIEAVRAVARGELYFKEQLPNAPILDSESNQPLDLSQREAEVLQLWSQGFSISDIGARLGVSEKTVANYQSLVRQKLGLENDVQLMRFAERLWGVKD